MTESHNHSLRNLAIEATAAVALFAAAAGNVFAASNDMEVKPMPGGMGLAIIEGGTQTGVVMNVQGKQVVYPTDDHDTTIKARYEAYVKSHGGGTQQAANDQPAHVQEVSQHSPVRASFTENGNAVVTPSTTGGATVTFKGGEFAGATVIFPSGSAESANIHVGGLDKTVKYAAIESGQPKAEKAKRFGLSALNVAVQSLSGPNANVSANDTGFNGSGGWQVRDARTDRLEVTSDGVTHGNARAAAQNEDFRLVQAAITAAGDQGIKLAMTPAASKALTAAANANNSTVASLGYGSGN